MTNYTKTTDFAAKDALPSGNSAKIVKGSEIDTEFNNIATASATKANANSAALTGTTTFETISDGTIAITAFVDEDNMASDSATLLPTQQSVKAYVDSQVTAQDLDFQADTGGALSIDLDSETLTFTGGTGVDTSGSGNAVTFAIDSTVATLTGTQTLSNKTLSTPVVSGNLTTDGLLDGRDVAADGTKLDGIESGATADQTAAEIKTAYESNANTNAFTDADESKLDGIEASADVTDTANVTAAGALMDSELTSEASVKALNQGVATTDSPTFAGLTTTADVSFGDNDKAIFGAGSDLQIYHDGSNNRIVDSGTGSLYIQGQQAIILANADATEFYATFDVNGASTLRYDNSQKLATTSTGIDVTGTVTADTAKIGGTIPASPDGVLAVRSDSDAHAISIYEPAGANENWQIGVDADGDLGFYNSGSTTAAVTVNDSNNVGIGTSSPSDLLDISANGTSAMRLSDSSSPATYAQITQANGVLTFAADAGNAQTGSNMQFEVDGSEAMRIDSLGRVLLNKTASTSSLTLESQAPSGFSIGSGFYSGSTQSTIEFKDSNTTANYKVRIGSETDDLVMFAGGSKRVTIDSAGQLRLGNSTPTWDTAFSSLVTKGGFIGSQSSSYLYSGQNAYYNGGFKYSTASAATLYEQSFGAHVFYNAASGTVGNAISFSEAMRIDSSGNLLVGKTSTAAGAGVIIGSSGVSNFTANGDRSLILNREASDGSILEFRKDNAIVGSIGTVAGRLFIGSDDTFLTFQGAADTIYPAAASGGGRDAAINLGASGTRFKDLYLSGGVRNVNGDGFNAATDGGEPALLPADTGGVLDGQGSLGLASFRWKDLYLSSKTKYQAAGGNLHSVGVDVNDLIIRSETAGSETARFTYSGNLLVGTTSFPSGTATTGSGFGWTSTGYKVQNYDNAGSIAMNFLNATSYVSGTVNFITFRVNGSTKGSITSNGTSTTYNTSSDQRLKENIADADDAGSKVDAIQVRKFDWIADGSHQDYGMIAQELQTVAPEAVHQPEDPDEMMGVDYSKLVPMLVKEIQSLRARVAQLEN